MKKNISFAQEISWTRSPSVEGLTTAIGSLTPRFLSNDTVKVTKLCIFLLSRCNCFCNVFLISNITPYSKVWAPKGGTAAIECHVANLGDRAVSLKSSFVLSLGF